MSPRLEALLAQVAGRISRYSPAEASASDAAIVEIRSQDVRERDGAIPGAYHVPRTVLEWRVASEGWRNTELDDRALILVCEDGYSSVLAAGTLIELGRDAGDVEGGFAAWGATGLPVAAPRVWGGLPGMGPPD